MRVRWTKLGQGRPLRRICLLTRLGIPYDSMQKLFRGEAIYQAEDDVHFALLNVAFTLEFAASLRTPQNRFPGVSRTTYAKHLRDVVMAMYGISHTASTKVGNDLVRGVSGGERKRVSIAEVTLSQSAVQCWDNSTRGLDAATAVDFTKSLRLSTEMTHSTTIAALYQAAEDSYNVRISSMRAGTHHADQTIPRLLIRSPSSTRVGKSILAPSIQPRHTSLTWVTVAPTDKLQQTS